MSGKGEENERDIGARAIITNPFVSLPSVPSQSQIPDLSSPTLYPTLPAPVIPTPANPFITTTPSIVPPLITSTEIVTITKNNLSLPAHSTVTPRGAATHTSTISVSSDQNNQKNTGTVNIAAIILGIMIGLVIVGGSIVILIQSKFSKNKENKENQSQRPSMVENVHNEVPTIELSERITDDEHQVSQRDSSIYFRSQFPLPPPRHQSPLPQHSPQYPQHPPQSSSTALYMSSSTYNTRNYSYEPPLSEHSAAIPNYYQKYSHLPLPTDTDVISPNSEQSQLSSTEILDK